MLLLLAAAVGAVSLIACANLGSLLLAHSQSRVREFAVRSAMGAASSRIARQLLVESLVLAAIGGIGGIWLANALVKGLVAVYPTQLPRANEIGLDTRVLLCRVRRHAARRLARWNAAGAAGSAARSGP
jgi:ABC-type antimicrobial peptide transport system permease subunit